MSTTEARLQETPLLGAEVSTEGPVLVRLPLDPAPEHAVLLVPGALQVAGPRRPGPARCRARSRRLAAGAGAAADEAPPQA